MRRYQRLVIAIIVVIAGAYLSVPIALTHAQTWLKHLQTVESNLLSSTSSSLAYPIKPDHWLTFALPDGSEQLRIITNAHIQQSETKALEPNWSYAIRYELLDKKNKVLTQGLYYQHSNLTLYKDEQNEALYGNYYLDKNTVPLDGRLILLGLQGRKDIAFLRISLQTINPAINEAAVRIYVPNKMSDHHVATAWLRMNKQQKDNLAKNSIYPASLLSYVEKINLLKHQWHPVGPTGVEGKNYRSLTLYTLKDVEQEKQDELMIAAGLQADAQHYGVIPIPEQGGQVELNFKALDGSALTSPLPINLHWLGRDSDQRWQRELRWSSDSDNQPFKVDGGLLVIRPSAPVIINAHLSTANQPKHDISDALLSIKTYKGHVSIDFGVLHYQQQPAALRIDVRRLLTSTDSTHQDPVRYQWLDAKQQVIGSGELKALAQASLFDRAGTITDDLNVTDPLSYYFNLPAQVSQLRLLPGNTNSLVSVYNQPYGVTKQQRVPEDAYIDNDKQDWQLSWFPLRAMDEDNLTRQQAIQWLIGQYRAQEDDPDLLAGHYLWQDYVPQDQVSARYLLTDYTGEDVRSEALASVYCKIMANSDLSIKLAALHGLQSIAPELIFLRSNTQPFNAELLLNQQKVAAMPFIGKQGTMPLSGLGIGTYQLRLNTNSGGQWLMNYQAQCNGEQYLKRRVFALNKTATLDFIVEHGSEDEVFSARLYSANNTDRSQIKVDIDAVKTTPAYSAISTNWTYKNRLYDIRPLSGKAIPILYTQGQTLTNGERFSIPLNSDLPPGSYHIRMALAKGAEGYITLSQIKAGQHEQRHFYREKGFDAQ